MKVALVYDRVNKWGGAERVLLALRELFPQAPLYTSVYNPQTAPWAAPFRVKTSFLQNFPYAVSAHELYPLLMPAAFESFTFDEYDLVVSVTSEAAKGIITKPHTKHLCYCLTPTRYLWSGYHEYFSRPLFKNLAKPAVGYLRLWDKVAAVRPDQMIAISKEVQQRVLTYYNRFADVIYPPSGLVPEIPVKRTKKKISDFLLIVSRLVPYKRVDLAIRACNRLKVPLKIIGSGSEEKRLRLLAGPTIEFLGQLPDKEVLSYYTAAKGLIFPGKEDFGITAVEAQSFGKPVLAYKAGGALETIIAGKTGEFFTPQTAEALAAQLEKFLKVRYNEEDCRRQAEAFSKERFKASFAALVVKSL